MAAKERLFLSWRRQRPGRLMTDARHGNSLLKNEQHLFTVKVKWEKSEEKGGKLLESGSNWVYLYG